MTPKEKAKELVGKYYNDSFVGRFWRVIGYDAAKRCASIAVYEILEEYSVFKKDVAKHKSKISFWQQVKEEIEKL